ncbi:MAG: hypothetical protein OXC07_01280 [Kistimonas sp.]|nr:hypothetical protein [Kistimonas sp.]
MTVSHQKNPVSPVFRLAAAVLTCVLTGGAPLVAAEPQKGRAVEIEMPAFHAGEFDDSVAQIARDMRTSFAEGGFPYANLGDMPADLQRKGFSEEEVTAGVVEGVQFYVVRHYIGANAKALYSHQESNSVHESDSCGMGDAISPEDVGMILERRIGSRFDLHNTEVRKAAAVASSRTLAQYSILVRPSKDYPGKMTVVSCSTVKSRF